MDVPQDGKGTGTGLVPVGKPRQFALYKVAHACSELESEDFK